jgi:hypothetical protein
MAALGGGSRFRSLLRLPTDQFSGQLSNFSKVVQDRPSIYTREYLVFAEGADIRDQALVIMSDQAHRMFPELALMSSIDARSSEPIASRLVGAQEAVAIQVESNIDKLQLRLTAGWRWFQRKFAMAVSLLFSLLIIFLWSPLDTIGLRGMAIAIVYWLFFGLIGGYLAVVAHHVLALVEIPFRGR